MPRVLNFIVPVAAIESPWKDFSLLYLIADVCIQHTGLHSAEFKGKAKLVLRNGYVYVHFSSLIFTYAARLANYRVV